MRCPACETEIVDKDALFCPRCGTSLGTSEGETTGRLDTPLPKEPGPPPAPPADGPPTSTDDQDHAPSARTRGESPAVLASDLAIAIRRAFVSGGWAHATKAAAFGSLALLAVGAMFTAAMKVADTTFGSGESPLWILTRLVLFGLFSLGVPIEQGSSGVSAVPLGALALIGWAIVWASERVVAESSADSAMGRALEGAKAGVPFGLICLITSIIFRIGGEATLAADAGMALLLGGLWGGLFGALGGLRARGPLRETALENLVGREGESPVARDGAVAGATMLLTSFLLATAALLIYLIIDLASGAAADLEGGQAILLIFVLAAFAPNIVTGVIGFSLGAPVSWGAVFGIGPNNELSLFGWGADSPPAYAYLAILIPLAACLFGGYVAWRRAPGSKRIAETLGVAAAIYAAALTVAVWLGNAGGTIGGGASFEIGPDALAVFLLGFAWAAAGGYLGWKVGEAPISPQPAEDVSAREPPRTGG